MDPISVSASLITLLAASGATCRALYDLTLDLRDAPNDIRLQNKKLQCLSRTISCLVQVYKALAKNALLEAHLAELEPHVRGVSHFIQDISSIEVKIQRKKDSLTSGRIAHAKECFMWLFFDRQLKKFFDNLEHYNIILSHAFMLAQIALLTQIMKQTAVPALPLTEAHSRTVVSPEMSTFGTSFNTRTGHIEVYNKPSIASLTMKRLLNRLRKTVDTAGILLRCQQQVHLGILQLEARSGPAITRRFSESGRSMYTAEGHALSVTVQSCHFCRKFTLVLYVLYNAPHIPSLNLRWNMHIASVIPLENPYFKAIQMGDINYLQSRISSGLFPVHVTTPGGYTLLHCAARYGRPDIISMLVENGADVNTRNDRGETPLHISVRIGRDYKCAHRLLELGADLCQPDSEGRTALHAFYNTVTPSILRHYINDLDTWAQDNKGMTVLHYLSWTSRSSAQDLLKCATVDTSSPFTSHSKMSSSLPIKDAQGKSVLHYAVQRGNLDLIGALLMHPDVAILSMSDHCGRTLLHYATESSRTQILDLFLSRGIDINAVDGKGRTVLHHACQWGNLKAVKHLVSLGMEYQLDIVDHENLSPLQLAELYAAHEVVEYLRLLRPNQPVGNVGRKWKDARACSCEPLIVGEPLTRVSWIGTLGKSLSFPFLVKVVLLVLIMVKITKEIE